MQVVTYLGGIDPVYEAQYQMLPGDTLRVEPDTTISDNPCVYVNPFGQELILLWPGEWCNLRLVRLSALRR